MIFQAFGPFEISLDKHRNIPERLDDFWAAVEAEKKGLSAAKGCYLFGVKTSGSQNIFPWYIGKTISSFYRECFQYHKLVAYQRSISVYQRSRPSILLIPRLAKGGGLYRGNSDVAINFLEKHLISLGLRANENLQNKRDTRLYRDVQLKGVLNSDSRAPDSATKELKCALGV